MACKVILKERYNNYTSALESLNLENLEKRREDLCLRFAKNCLRFEKTKTMFPLNIIDIDAQSNLRNTEKFHVQFANTSRLLDSAIPQLQRALNADAKKK